MADGTAACEADAAAADESLEARAPIRFACVARCSLSFQAPLAAAAAARELRQGEALGDRTETWFYVLGLTTDYIQQNVF